MQTKSELLALLREEFGRWDQMLARLGDEQVQAIVYDNRAIKDEVAHLWMWQRISGARVKAALEGTEPDLSWWHEEYEPEDEDHINDINEWIYQSNKATDWSTVYADWRSGFQEFIEMASTVPEADLTDVEKYAWLNGYPLMAVLDGTYDHHHVDHFPGIIKLLQERGW